MTACRVILAAITLGSLAHTASADADSLTDFLGPRELSMGESMRASATGAKAITLNPAGLSLTRQLVFEGVYGVRADDEGQTIAVSACDSTVPVPGCFYYGYFSQEPKMGGVETSRRVHQFGWAASRALTERIIIGTNTKYFDYNSDLAGEEDVSGFAFDAGLVVRPMQALNVAVVGYNLIADDTPEYPRGIGTGIALKPASIISLSADAVWNLDQEGDESTGRYGGGAELFLTSGDQLTGYPFRAGIVRDVAINSTFATAGIGFVNPKLGIDIGLRKQVDGGDELTILGALRLFGPHVK